MMEFTQILEMLTGISNITVSVSLTLVRCYQPVARKTTESSNSLVIKAIPQNLNTRVNSNMCWQLSCVEKRVENYAKIACDRMPTEVWTCDGLFNGCHCCKGVKDQVWSAFYEVKSSVWACVHAWVCASVSWGVGWRIRGTDENTRRARLC